MYKFDKYDFGKRLKVFRKSQGLTQNEFADKLGVERSNISRYENGETLPSIETFLEMCNILNIDIENITEKKEFFFDQTSYYLNYKGHRFISEKIIDILKD